MKYKIEENQVYDIRNDKTNYFYNIQEKNSFLFLTWWTYVKERKFFVSSLSCGTRLEKVKFTTKEGALEYVRRLEKADEINE